MDLLKIQEFVEFSKTMNFTVAAEKLNLSQPSFSKHVHDIETELGVVLVKRGMSGASNELTPAGVRFVELAKDLLQRYDYLVDECVAIGSAIPPARIQDVRYGYNITAQLRHRLDLAGDPTGNFAYVRCSLPPQDALDKSIVDFAVHMEPDPWMTAFDRDDLRDTYGWIALKPEALNFLVAAGNPLFGCGSANMSEIASYEIVSSSSTAYESWYTSIPTIFARHGFSVNPHPLSDLPFDGGAFPIGRYKISICTERFASYYRDLGVEDVDMIRVADFEPIIYPFLVFRKDCVSPVARNVIDLLSSEDDKPADAMKPSGV